MPLVATRSTYPCLTLINDATRPELPPRQERELCRILTTAGLSYSECLVYLLRLAIDTGPKGLAERLGCTRGVVVRLLDRACDRLEPWRSELYDFVLLPAAQAMIGSMVHVTAGHGPAMSGIEGAQHVTIEAADVADRWLAYLFGEARADFN